MTATHTPIHGRGTWMAEADRLAKKVPVAEREAQAVRGIFRELLASGASADELALFITASIFNREGGSPALGDLLKGAIRSRSAVKMHGSVVLDDVDPFIDAMLAEIES